MEQNNYIFWGMHVVWWLIWIIAIISLMVNLFKLSGKVKNFKEKPLEILQKRFAAGQINRKDYLKDREIIIMAKDASIE